MNSASTVKELPATGFNIEILLDVILQILQIIQSIASIFGLNLGGTA